MKRLLAKFCAILVLAGAAGSAPAQDASADQIIQNGLQVLKQIDAGQTGDVWENAAPFIKARFPKAELMSTLTQSRQTVGVIAVRTWASVNRVRFVLDTPANPAGLYANVDYSTRLANGQTVFELLSFRQEADGGWHLTGYVPRQTQ